MLRTLALIVEYDGTAFHGWQAQNGFRTVASELQKALEAVTHAPVKLFGASRTDAGVHARGQVAHFTTDCAFPIARIHAGLRHILPEDMAVLEMHEKPAGFHARHDAKGKWYRYTVLQRSVPPALERAHVMFTWEKMRLAPMEKAAKLLLGTHDFSSFGVNSGTEPENTVKTMHRVNVREIGGHDFAGNTGTRSRIKKPTRVMSRISPNSEKTFVFDIVGNSFLYRMVRSMVGTIIQIGQGKRDPESMSAIIDRKDRAAAGITVPPQGLTLMKVFYEDDLSTFLKHS